MTCKEIYKIYNGKKLPLELEDSTMNLFRQQRDFSSRNVILYLDDLLREKVGEERFPLEYLLGCHLSHFSAYEVIYSPKSIAAFAEQSDVIVNGILTDSFLKELSRYAI